MKNISEEYLDSKDSSLTSIVQKIMEKDLESGNELLSIGILIWIDENRRKKGNDTRMIISELPTKLPVHIFIHYALSGTKEESNVVCSLYLDGLCVTTCGAVDAVTRYLIVTDLFNVIPSNNFFHVIFRKYVLLQSGKGEAQVLASVMDAAIIDFWKNHPELQPLLHKPPDEMRVKRSVRKADSPAIIKRVLQTPKQTDLKPKSTLNPDEYKSISQLQGKYKRKAPLQMYCMNEGLKTTGSIQQICERIWTFWHPEDALTQSQVCTKPQEEDSDFQISDTEMSDRDEYSVCSECLHTGYEDEFTICCKCQESLCIKCISTCNTSDCESDMCSSCKMRANGSCPVCEINNQKHRTKTSKRSLDTNDQEISQPRRRRRLNSQKTT